LERKKEIKGEEMKFEEYEISKEYYEKYGISTENIEKIKQEWNVEDEIEIEELKEKINEYMKTNHPLYIRSQYYQDGKWINRNQYEEHKKMYQTKMINVSYFYKKMVLDNYMERRMRKMRKEKKDLHFEFDFMEIEELNTKMDETNGYVDANERKVMREFDMKIQMEYFNESFQEKSEKVNENDPLNEFFQNQIHHVKDKVGTFESNDRILRNEEWVNYENQREQIANEVNYENIPMENFNAVFEKNRNRIPQDEDILNGFSIHHQTVPFPTKSSQNRPLTLEELLKERDDII
jgi:hypothetical protein